MATKRTHLILNADIQHAAKVRALKDRVSLGDFVNEAIRREVERRDRADERRTDAAPTPGLRVVSSMEG
ncbi:hypothetical protein R75465_02214 [Paraburkholderia aspalathi]|uniref:hypothetical protein n=1 Tax=Paraburkholderia aspalathi TaxID=1324617 RepID=UPI001B0A0478|nr:hypothetical protein [Paraburkholderia aspalathi]CAE6739777.1 hypothetical protein R75465_02214 [Paraburkholderia aspalathi]